MTQEFMHLNKGVILMKKTSVLLPKHADRESLTLITRDVFLELIEKARAEIKAGKKLSLADMKREASLWD